MSVGKWMLQQASNFVLTGGPPIVPSPFYNDLEIDLMFTGICLKRIGVRSDPTLVRSIPSSTRNCLATRCGRWCSTLL